MPEEQPVIRTARDATWRSVAPALVPDQLLVGEAMGAVGLGAELLVAEALVGLEVALEPADLRVTLEGQDMGGDAVQEPAIVGDHDGAAGEGQQGLLER